MKTMNACSRISWDRFFREYGTASAARSHLYDVLTGPGMSPKRGTVIIAVYSAAFAHWASQNRSVEQS